MKNKNKGIIFVPLLILSLFATTVATAYINKDNIASTHSAALFNFRREPARSPAILPMKPPTVISPITSANKITGCVYITNPGNYTVEKDLVVTSNNCLDFENASNVHIDCGGHSITLNNSEPKHLSLLNLKNIKNFSVKSCNLKIANPNVSSTILSVLNSSNGTISNNTFYDQNLSSTVPHGSQVTIAGSSNYITLDNNTFYGRLQNDASNITVTNNTFAPSLMVSKQNPMVVEMHNGNNNVVRNNTIDGKWDGRTVTTGQKPLGADDGILLNNQNNALIQGNKIKNNWDCGIETIGTLKNSKILSNTISSNLLCGIGAWFSVDWQNNIVEDNIIESSHKMFVFFRYSDADEENPIIFVNNTFSRNKFLNPTESGVSSSEFIFGEKHKNGKPYTARNNKMIGNDFNMKQRAPDIRPTSIVVDGGGNICDSSGYYEGESKYPLSCSGKAPVKPPVTPTPTPSPVVTPTPTPPSSPLSNCLANYTIVAYTGVTSANVKLSAIGDASKAPLAQRLVGAKCNSANRLVDIRGLPIAFYKGYCGGAAPSELVLQRGREAVAKLKINSTVINMECPSSPPIPGAPSTGGRPATPSVGGTPVAPVGPSTGGRPAAPAAGASSAN